MVRKLFCSMFVMTLAIGFVAAEEFNATITKVDGDKVTYQKYKKATEKGKKGEKDGDAVTITAKGATVAKNVGKKGQFEVGDKIEDGLKNEMFTKISDKGVNARITTDGEGDKATKITQILVIGGKKKKGAN
jgi:hypothetical protein